MEEGIVEESGERHDEDNQEDQEDQEEIKGYTETPLNIKESCNTISLVAL